MFSPRITGYRRAMFADWANRNLRRALRIHDNQDNSLAIEHEIEEDIVLTVEETEQKLTKIRALLAAIPRGIRRVVQNNVLERIREALHGLRIDQIPEELMEQLNNIL